MVDYEFVKLGLGMITYFLPSAMSTWNYYCAREPFVIRDKRQKIDSKRFLEMRLD
jgi:hypothetical protein